MGEGIRRDQPSVENILSYLTLARFCMPTLWCQLAAKTYEALTLDDLGNDSALVRDARANVYCGVNTIPARILASREL